MSRSVDSDAYTKPLHPSALQDRSGGFGIRTFLRKLLGWPGMVICFQVLLQVGAWSSFAVVEARGSVALPYSSAVWVKANPRTVTLISTLISTILASCSSYLFSFGVSRSIGLYLRRPMSLAALVSTVRISTRTLVLNPRRWKWSAISILLVIFTGVQTSGWSTLITPAVIVIEIPVSGSELDLTTPVLREMMNSGALDDCIYNSSLSTPFFVGSMESGHALSASSRGYSAFFTLMDLNFNISTAGILPATLTDFDVSPWFSNSTVIPSAIQGADLRQGVERQDIPMCGKLMWHEGFSADVICKFQDLTNDTSPPLRGLTDTVTEWKKTGDASNLGLGDVTFTDIATLCIGNATLIYSYTISMHEPNYILMVACGPVDNYTLIFNFAGIYEWPTTVCTLSPKITKVYVEYSDPTSVAISSTATFSDAASPDPDGPTGLTAAVTMYNMVFLAQTAESNIMGDLIDSLLFDVADDNLNQSFLAAMEDYIQGVSEYSGSVFRACLSGNGRPPFADGLPGDLTVPTSGTIFTQTMGWTRLSARSTWVLVPGTLVALTTIIVVVVAVAQHAGDPPTRRDLFNPSDAMHLVAAAAAGGLSDVFTGTSEEAIKDGERVTVVLRSIPGQGAALIRT
ncbi:hypothetical protein B0H17DRAFT_1230206 [Mycena rosella]|uniref:Transmembrane protein n=1 Tax=Mycena rosella TaxID=1033263 RepID=A0AAD7F913_MYCRO|nr:hypothetical protein B0H17DRAFT_1230206 [Mycena rosella]